GGGPCRGGQAAKMRSRRSRKPRSASRSRSVSGCSPPPAPSDSVRRCSAAARPRASTASEARSSALRTDSPGSSTNADCTSRQRPRHRSDSAGSSSLSGAPADDGASAPAGEDAGVPADGGVRVPSVGGDWPPGSGRSGVSARDGAPVPAGGAAGAPFPGGGPGAVPGTGPGSSMAGVTGGGPATRASPAPPEPAGGAGLGRSPGRSACRPADRSPSRSPGRSTGGSPARGPPAGPWPGRLCSMSAPRGLVGPRCPAGPRCPVGPPAAVRRRAGAAGTGVPGRVAPVTGLRRAPRLTGRDRQQFLEQGGVVLHGLPQVLGVGLPVRGPAADRVGAAAVAHRPALLDRQVGDLLLETVRRVDVLAHHDGDEAVGLLHRRLGRVDEPLLDADPLLAVLLAPGRVQLVQLQLLEIGRAHVCTPVT